MGKGRRATCEEGTQTAANWVENENYFGWFGARDWNSFAFKKWDPDTAYMRYLITLICEPDWNWFPLIEQYEKGRDCVTSLCDNASARKYDAASSFECAKSVEHCRWAFKRD